MHGTKACPLIRPALKNQETKSDPTEALLNQPLQHRGGDSGLISSGLAIYQDCSFVNMDVFMLYAVSVIYFPTGF